MIAFIAIALLVVILVGSYLYFYFLRIADFWRLNSKSKMVRIVAILLSLCLGFFSMNVFGFCALVVFHIIALSLLMDLLNFICIVFHKHRGLKIDLWKKVYSCGFVPVVITALILGNGYFKMENVIEKTYTIHTEKSIRQQGYRIAMIADLHFGTTMDEEKLKEYCNEIEKKHPDLIVLCGDIVDENTSLQQMKNAINILSKIKSTYGTFYVYGNHDKNTYDSSPNFHEEQLKKQLESNGINVLADEVYKINDDFTIIGRKDRGFTSENKRKTCEELLKSVDTHSFLLLLDHQPSELQENSKEGIDLQLSGHTHGGQIWPQGILNKIAGMFNYGYGKFDNYQIVVTSGIGGYGYPIRTEGHSEYVIIDVKK